MSDPNTVAPKEGGYYADRLGRVWGPMVPRTPSYRAFPWGLGDTDNLRDIDGRKIRTIWAANGAFYDDIEDLWDELDLVREITADEFELRKLAETDDTAKAVLADWLIEHGIEVSV